MALRDKFTKYSLEFVNFNVGAVVLTFELVAARIVTPYIGNTIYTWTSIIGVILAALAAGYSFGGKLADRRKQPDDVVGLLSLAAAWILIMTVLKDGILGPLSGNSLPLQLKALFAGLILFAVPTFLLGAASPYLARLSITDLKTSGQKLARMSAAGTAGSLLGTFLTGYLLFGYLGTHLILCLLILTIVSVSFVLSRRFLFGLRLLLILTALLLSLSPVPASVSGLISDTDTAYSRVLIRDVQLAGGPARVLQNDNEGLQSGEFLDGSGRLAFGYIRAFSYLSRLRMRPGNSLIVGGGAFSFPSYLARNYPDTDIEVVELDGKLQKLSTEYFGFKKADNLEIHTEDGRAFLNRNRREFDMVYIDAFTSVIPPFQLLTHEADVKLKASLKPDGLAVMNIISPVGGEPLHSTAKTLKSVFPYVLAFPVVPSLSKGINQNLILVASNKKITAGQLADLAVTPEEEGFASNVFIPDTSGAVVMTDSYAPIERFVGNNL